eukprot:9563702-Prorocentrum_lima.AAC.1
MITVKDKEDLNKTIESMDRSIKAVERSFLVVVEELTSGNNLTPEVEIVPEVGGQESARVEGVPSTLYRRDEEL